MSFIIIDDQIQTKNGNSRNDLLQLLEEMPQEDDKYQYLKFICCQEKINAQAPDFSRPIFLFNYQTLDCVQMKLQENVKKINKLLQENQQLKESQNNNNVSDIEQILYKELYDETQEKLCLKIVEYDQLLAQYSALENQQQDILKKSQNHIQGLCQKCLTGNDKIKQDNLRLTQNLTNEQNKNNKLEKELRDMKSEMQQLVFKHQNELDQVQNQKKMEYIDQLSKTQNMICKPCRNKQFQIDDLENKIKNSEQIISNKIFEADRRIKQKDDEVIELRKQLSFNKIIKCQCLEKDQKIQQLQNKLEDLEYQLSKSNKELENLKMEYNDKKIVLEIQNEKNANLRDKINELSNDLQKQKKLQSEQQQVIKSANMEQQRFYDQLMEYEIKFQKMIQDKIEVDKQLNQQLESLTSNDQPRIMTELRKYIQNQDKNLNQMAQEHTKFKEDFKLQMSLITKQTIRSSIIIQQKRYQE